MKTGWWRKMGWGAASVALTMMMSAPDVSAQADDQDCRCVDSDGDAIESCTCFVIPDVPDYESLVAFGPNGDFDFSFAGPRPRLGVTVSTGQDDALDAQGALVSNVMDDGPADDAGIRADDIITSVDGRSLFEPLSADAEEDFDLDESLPVQRLLAIARELDPGEDVEVEYLRDGQAQTATVEVQNLEAVWGAWGQNFRAEIMPQMEQLRLQFRDGDFRTEIMPQMEQLREQIRVQGRDVERARRDVQVFQDRSPFIQRFGVSRDGLQMVELTPGLGSYFGTEEGVLVSDVDEDSPLGLLPGDVILRVGDREATSPDRVRRILDSYGDDEDVTFRVRRQGSEIDVLGRLDG
jgi:hypothetical protein